MNDNEHVQGVDQIVSNLTLLSPAIGKRIAVALDITAKEVVNFARQNHPYTDRTTNLTQSIDQGDIVIHKNGVEAYVVARQPYASFVEEGTRRSKPYPFLWPAVARHQKVMIKRVANAYKEGERVIKINEGIRNNEPT